jgi:hypothetical protein
MRRGYPPSTPLPHPGVGKSALLDDAVRAPKASGCCARKGSSAPHHQRCAPCGVEAQPALCGRQPKRTTSPGQSFPASNAEPRSQNNFQLPVKPAALSIMNIGLRPKRSATKPSMMAPKIIPK